MCVAILYSEDLIYLLGAFTEASTVDSSRPSIRSDAQLNLEDEQAKSDVNMRTNLMEHRLDPPTKEQLANEKLLGKVIFWILERDFPIPRFQYADCGNFLYEKSTKGLEEAKDLCPDFEIGDFVTAERAIIARGFMTLINQMQLRPKKAEALIKNLKETSKAFGGRGAESLRQ